MKLRPVKDIFLEDRELQEDWIAFEYSQYLKFCERTNYGRKLEEFSLPSFIKDKIKVLEQIAAETGFKIVDLLKLFADKTVFAIFSATGWNIKNFFNLIKEGYDLYKNLHKKIDEFLEKNPVVQWTKEKIKELDNWLHQHAGMKRVAGFALAGLLIYMWTEMTFISNPLYDFDISSILDVLKGHYSLIDLFLSAAGQKMLSLFLLGTLTGLSFPWPGSNLVKFLVAILFTLAKKLKIHLQQTHLKKELELQTTET